MVKLWLGASGVILTTAVVYAQLGWKSSGAEMIDYRMLFYRLLFLFSGRFALTAERFLLNFC